VRNHVKAINEIIQAAKNAEVEERRMQERYAHPLLESNAAGGACLDAVAFCAAPASAAAPAFAPRMMARSAAPLGMAPPAAAAAPAPPPPQCAPTTPQPQPAAQQPQQQGPSEAGTNSGSTSFRDYTQVPREMDQRFEKLDVDTALRPTIIKPSERLNKRTQKALLAKPTMESLGKDEQKRERDAAFDLLDALTKSGGLAVTHASLHIVVAATHCFDKTLTETIIQDNMNPIDKVERSTLIMATTVHQQPAAALIRESQLPRVGTVSPMLFLQEESSAAAA